MSSLNVLVYSAFEYTAFLYEGSEQAKRLEYAFPDIHFVYRDRETVTLEDAKRADVIVGHPTPEMLKAAENLKWLHVNSAGVNGYEKRELYPNEYMIVTRAADTFGISMAEHTVGMMISLSRNFRLLDRQQRGHVWRTYRADCELFGSTVLMLGAGNLAEEIARRLEGFGVKRIAVKRDPGQKPGWCEAVYGQDRLHEALKQADYVINSLPLTDETRHILDAKAFDAMKPSTILINIGRGGTVDTDALVDALREGKLYAAGLDVTEPEPLPADSPLWDMENVIISPHSSALSGEENRRRTDTIIKLMRQYIMGDDLDYEVDFEKGY